MIRNNKPKKCTKPVHDHCEWMVFPRGPHVALYCAEHQAYIKFVNPREQAALRHTNTVWLNHTPSWVLERADSKKTKKKTATR